MHTQTHTHLCRTSHKRSAFPTHHCYVAVEADFTPVNSWINASDAFRNHPDLVFFCSERTVCGPNVSLRAQLLADIMRVNATISLPA